MPAWQEWFDELVADGRAGMVAGWWAPTERVGTARAVDRSLADPMAEGDEPWPSASAGISTWPGRSSVARLVADGPLPSGIGAGRPGHRGQGPYRPGPTGGGRLGHRSFPTGAGAPATCWCACTPPAGAAGAGSSSRPAIADFVRFLACWQHVAAGTQAEGRAGLLAVIEQLQGIEVAAGEWERSVLAARVAGYDPRWLDELCLAGEVAWARLTPATRPPDRGRPRWRQPATTRSAGPMAAGTGGPEGADRHPLAGDAAGPHRPRGHAVDAGRRPDRPGRPPSPTGGRSADLLSVLRAWGACFRSELAAPSGRLPSEVDEGLWDLVARGMVTADAFSAVRSLLSTRGRPSSGWAPVPPAAPDSGPRRARAGTGVGEGRWSLVPEPDDVTTSPSVAPAAEELAEAVAGQMLARWGVVAWELWARESFRIPWRDVVRALRRLEARGQVLGREVRGRYVRRTVRLGRGRRPAGRRARRPATGGPRWRWPAPTRST